MLWDYTFNLIKEDLVAQAIGRDVLRHRCPLSNAHIGEGMPTDSLYSLHKVSPKNNHRYNRDLTVLAVYISANVNAGAMYQRTYYSTLSITEYCQLCLCMFTYINARLGYGFGKATARLHQGIVYISDCLYQLSK
jgi:hypothetical protein